MLELNNISNQLIVCSLADESTLRLYPHTLAQIKENQLTNYLKDLEAQRVITIQVIDKKSASTVESATEVDEKKKNKKEEK